MRPEFEAYPQPEWNTRSSVKTALSSMDDVKSEAESRAAYHTLLYAVGNNHAGTYFPVALAVIPELGGKLDSKSQWTRHAAVNVLVDLCCSFHPEQGYENFEGTGVAAGIRAATLAYAPSIERVARDDALASQDARDLLAALTEST